MGYRSSVYIDMALDKEQAFYEALMDQCKFLTENEHDATSLYSEAKTLLDDIRQGHVKTHCAWHHNFIKWYEDDTVCTAISEAVDAAGGELVRYGEDQDDVTTGGGGGVGCWYSLHRVFCQGNRDAVDCAAELLEGAQNASPEDVAHTRKILTEILNRLPKT